MSTLPCRWCGASFIQCMEALDMDGGYCCDGCKADDDAGIPPDVTHPFQGTEIRAWATGQVVRRWSES